MVKNSSESMNIAFIKYPLILYFPQKLSSTCLANINIAPKSINTLLTKCDDTTTAVNENPVSNPKDRLTNISIDIDTGDQSLLNPQTMSPSPKPLKIPPTRAKTLNSDKVIEPTAKSMIEAKFKRLKVISFDFSSILFEASNVSVKIVKPKAIKINIGRALLSSFAFALTMASIKRERIENPRRRIPCQPFFL